MSSPGFQPEQGYLLICETVLAECASLLPPELERETIPFALHTDPERLRGILQERIDTVPAGKEFILLGFGLCSNAVAGLSSRRQTIVVPRIHDCIALFCGSQQVYDRYTAENPRTLFLTRRYIESERGEYHLLEYDRYKRRYGAKGARRMIALLLEHYRRTALLVTGEYAAERYRRRGRRFARRYKLEYSEIKGSRRLMEKLVGGDWDRDFIRVDPGVPVELKEFLPLPGEP